MNPRYQEVTESLRTAYDGAVEHRDRTEKAPWKITERAGFLRRLRDEGCQRLLELGAGTGQDSVFFAGHGLQVVATDLSPKMVACCREKGLDARVMDLLHLDFPAESFDAVYTLNCLLHVPNADLPAAGEVIASVLRPGGLFFLGVYGHDVAEEGPFEDGIHHPPRFFSWRTDEQIQQFARRHFDIVDFHVVAPERQHFQSLTLRR
jgi:SAM-dependent methyltransferase